MGFDVQGAKQAGYSDAEIADYLANERGFDAKGARDSGYNDAEIISHLTLSGPQEQKKGEELLETENQWLDTLSGSQRILKAPETPSGVQEPSLLGGDEFALAREVVNSNPATQTLANVIPSGGMFLKNITMPLIKPMETIEGIGRVGVGAIEKLIPGEQEDEKYANAVGQFFKERYGGAENIAKTIETDPVGFLADLSGVFGLGSVAVSSKSPAVSKALSTAAKTTDPLSIVSGAVNNTATRTVANKLTGDSLDKGFPFSDKRARVIAGDELNQLRKASPEERALFAKRMNEWRVLRRNNPNLPRPTYGQMTGNMAVAAKEQSLSMTPEAMRRFTFGDSSVNDAALNQVLQKVGPEQNLTRSVVGKQEQGRAIAGSIEANRRRAKIGVENAYDSIPNDPVESIGIKQVADDLRAEKATLTDAEYPGWAISKIEKIFGKGKGKPEYSYTYESGVTQKPVTSAEVPFQDLHAFRKELGQAIRDAEVGANPNYALSRNLKKIKSAVDDAIDAAGNTSALSDSYKAAKEAYVAYSDRFKTGQTAKVLQRGRQITGLNVPDEQIAARFWSADGADDFIRAVGKNRASGAMREYAASEIIPFLEKEIPDIKGAMKWMTKNKVQIAKYGLGDELNNLVKSQVPSALRKQVESVRMNIKGNPQLTIPQVKRLISDYGPALRILYNNDPGALRALMDYQKVLKVLNRNKAVSFSKGSNTGEKLSGARMVTELATLEAIGMGKGWIFSSAKNIIRGLASGPIRGNQAKINQLLLDAAFDPKLAKQLMNLAKNPRDKKAISNINKWAGKSGRMVLQNVSPGRYEDQSFDESDFEYDE